MDNSTMAAPAWALPGDTTYVGQNAYTVTPQQTIEQVQEADVAGLETAGYTRSAALSQEPVAASEPETEPTTADQPL